MNLRKLVRLLKSDGWYEVGKVGSYQHFKNPTKQGKVKVEIAKKMLLEQCDSTLIQNVTGLTLDNICGIQTEMNVVQ